eukprot:4215308-Prymnesium_polylepis.2
MRCARHASSCVSRSSSDLDASCQTWTRRQQPTAVRGARGRRGSGGGGGGPAGAQRVDRHSLQSRHATTRRQGGRDDATGGGRGEGQRRRVRFWLATGGGCGEGQRRGVRFWLLLARPPP